MAMNEGFMTSLAGDEDLAALRRRLLEDEAAAAAVRAGGMLPSLPPGGGVAQSVAVRPTALPAAASVTDVWKSGGLPEVPRGAVLAGLGGAGAGAGLVGVAATAADPWGDRPREARPNHESAFDADAWREAERQRVDAEMMRGYQRWVEEERRPAAPPEIRTLEWRYDRDGLRPLQIQRLDSRFDGDGVGPPASEPFLPQAEAPAPVPRVPPPPAQPVRSEPVAGGLSGAGMFDPSALRKGAAQSVWGKAGAGAGWQPQAATPGTAVKRGDGDDDEHTSGYAEGRPSAAAVARPALWQGLTTLGEEGEVVDRFMNGDWLVRTGPQRQERAFRDAQVAAMTGMQRGELDSFIEQHGLARDDAPVALPESAAGHLPAGGGPTLAQVYEGEPQGLQRVTGRALASLRRQLTPGLLGRVQVHATLADWLATPAGQRWTPQQVQAMQGAEGFYDPASGTRVILAGGISPRRGESPRAAVERVVRHTAVTPDLLDRLLGTGQRAVQYDNLTKLIRPEDLRELQARNPALLQHPRLAGLDFVGYIQHQRPDIALNERSVPSRLVQTLGLAEEEFFKSEKSKRILSYRPTPTKRTTVKGLASIPPYTDGLPSPLKLWWYVPELNEAFDPLIKDQTVRSWVRDAASYQDVPLEIMAVILQQENGPNATLTRKIGQFGERSLTTALQIADEYLFDVVPDKAFGKSIANGSSGIANLQRATLRSAADYSENVLRRAPLPHDVHYRLFGYDQDSRIPGDDLKADLYYQAAHIRQLIDRITGKHNFNGPLTLDLVRKVIKAYNGSGPVADKYASDAMKKLSDAASNITPLYFYEP